jgi:hypothetical protein
MRLPGPCRTPLRLPAAGPSRQRGACLGPRQRTPLGLRLLTCRDGLPRHSRPACQQLPERHAPAAPSSRSGRVAGGAGRAPPAPRPEPSRPARGRCAARPARPARARAARPPARGPAGAPRPAGPAARPPPPCARRPPPDPAPPAPAPAAAPAAALRMGRRAWASGVMTGTQSAARPQRAPPLGPPKQCHEQAAGLTCSGCHERPT